MQTASATQRWSGKVPTRILAGGLPFTGDISMARSKTQTVSRWLSIAPSERVQPIGPVECIERAVAQLGPFEFKTFKESKSASLGRDPLPSEEHAFGQVWHLAMSFRRDQYLGRGAPRHGDVIRQITRVGSLANELARHLDSLDDITRRRLKTCGTEIPLEIFKSPIFDEANVRGLPEPLTREQKSDPDQWIARLDALSRYAEMSVEGFLRAECFSSTESADKGGNTNVYRTRYGSPNWALVDHGWYLYERHKPGKATGTVG
jgi:hypothetical protein